MEREDCNHEISNSGLTGAHEAIFNVLPERAKASRAPSGAIWTFHRSGSSQ